MAVERCSIIIQTTILYPFRAIRYSNLYVANNIELHAENIHRPPLVVILTSLDVSAVLNVIYYPQITKINEKDFFSIMNTNHI